MTLRIAILAHSTNPRGGVMHALELGDALVRRGVEATVLAPDASGRGFFRSTLCRTVSVPASPLPRPHDTHALVETRQSDYVAYLCDPARRQFDVFHAQDGLSANALATLKQRGLIGGFARTVHHLDDFADPRVAALQDRSIIEADAHFVVSALWQERLAGAYGVEATIVGNGVDLDRFTPEHAPDDLCLRNRLGLRSGPVFLAIGGVEARKNTIRTLQAFVEIRRAHPEAQLVIAGGASLLDHGTYQARYAAALAASGLPADAVKRIGTVTDADMPALYRIADALVFPSVKEGFGLVVLEALASGCPVVCAAGPPFTGYLGPDVVAWCAPDEVGSIAAAMAATLAPERRAVLRDRGRRVAGRHSWDDTARAHLDVYQRLGAPAYA